MKKHRLLSLKSTHFVLVVVERKHEENKLKDLNRIPIFFGIVVTRSGMSNIQSERPHRWMLNTSWKTVDTVREWLRGRSSVELDNVGLHLENVRDCVGCLIG